MSKSLDWFSEVLLIGLGGLIAAGWLGLAWLISLWVVGHL